MTFSPTYRDGDQAPRPRDSEDRYFRLEDSWYFTTREGMVMGPYTSRAHAISATQDYIDFVTSANSQAVKLMKKGHANVSSDDSYEESASYSPGN